MAELEAAVLRYVHEREAGGDSAEVAAAQKVDHQAVIGAVKSLESAEIITAEVTSAPRAQTSSYLPAAPLRRCGRPVAAGEAPA